MLTSHLFQTTCFWLASFEGPRAASELTSVLLQNQGTRLRVCTLVGFLEGERVNVLCHFGRPVAGAAWIPNGLLSNTPTITIANDCPLLQAIGTPLLEPVKSASHDFLRSDSHQVGPRAMNLSFLTLNTPRASQNDGPV